MPMPDPRTPAPQRAAPVPLLTDQTVLGYLHRRGVIDRPAGLARVLGGGVSNIVLLVEAAGRRVVVKQALGKLRVTDDWYADRSRAQAEATALQLAAGIVPGAVPAVLDSDPEWFALTIEAAPRDWVTWKQRLFAGDANPATAAWLGQVLRRWHDHTDQRPLPAQLENIEAFRQLRLDPYFTVSATRRPDLAPLIEHVADELTRRRRCLVSGDYSPKNVLVGQNGGWVIDWEAAHRGDPTFDVAFLLSHLLLKALHLPAHRAALRGCADAFRAGYGPQLGAADPGHLHALTGCLLLARVIGSSPVEYLTPPEQRRAQAAAAAILRHTPASFDHLWQTVAGR
jgi:hypothetical protein